MANMKDDEYRKEFGHFEYDSFTAEQETLEQNSDWLCCGKDMSVSALPDPIEFPTMNNGIDMDILMDTMDNTNLMLNFSGRTECIRSSAISGLHDNAGISGPCFSDMNKKIQQYKIDMATIFSLGLKAHARNLSYVLMRWGKVTSIVSDRYEFMPITQLLKIVDGLESQFGTAEFIGGSISHELTMARFRYPESTQVITDAYNSVLSACGKAPTSSLTPVVEFRSSDTTQEAARLVTYLESSGSSFHLIPFGSGVTVVHKASDKNNRATAGKSGIELFEEESNLLFSKLGDEISTLIPKMLSVEIKHPGNAFISICKYAGIPQKWGGVLEEDVRAMYEPQGCTFLDLYMSLTEVTSLAVRDGYSPESSKIIELEDGISKVARNPHRWTATDFAGTISW